MEEIGTTHPWGAAPTPYEELGGDSRVRELVDAFYDRIDAEAPTVRAMLPANDAGSRRKLYEFLSGWLGGPPLYVSKRGHPRMRMRHLPFAIGADEAAEWMRCMRLALDDTGVGEPLRSFLDERLTMMADHMVNR